MRVVGDTDAVLVARCCEGDARAFDELVRRHRERALALARRQVADDRDAEDIVQQAFLYAYASVRTLREGGKFGAWLATVISRLALRFRREQARPHSGSAFADGEQLLAALPAPARDEAAEEVRERVQAILGELTRQHREVLELFYLEGLSCQEVADQLGVPLGTIKRRLHDSRERFQREWTKMASTAERGRMGRRMRTWIVGRIYNEASPLMSTLLAQTIALAIHKRSLTAARIAEKVGADREYVDDVLSRMVHLELAIKQRDRYLLNFIALDRDDYAELQRQARETGRELAPRLAPTVPEVQAAYERTGMAARGWTWEQVQAVITLAFVYNAGVARSAPEVVRRLRYEDIPLRPDGERWYLGGIELEEAAPVLPGCRMRALSGGGTGVVRWPGLAPAAAAHLREDSVPLLRSLAERSRTLTEILTEAGGPGEECRAALVRLLEQGLGRRKGSRFEALFPIFQQPDIETLLPVVDRAVGPAAREVLRPRAQEADALLARLGYGRLPDQAVWMRESLFSHDVRGWTMLFLADLGVLRRPPSTPPPHWGYFGWLGDGGDVFATRG